MKLCPRLFAVATALLAAFDARASGHGPLFGLATPTNAKGGWSLDTAVMGRTGYGASGSMFETMLSYGITEDLQLSLTAPAVFRTAPLPPARVTGMMPTSGDFEGIAAWRFYRRAPRVGTRFESTVYGGLLVPGPQQGTGMLGNLKRAPGFYTAVAAGVASRVHYFWAGVENTHYVERGGDQRPNLLGYTAVYGYRPRPGRKDYPHLDWRLFGEMTAEQYGETRRASAAMPGTSGNQVFLGPTALVIYKSYAIEGGVQFPIARDVGPGFKHEKARFAVNFSYFF